MIACTSHLQLERDGLGWVDFVEVFFLRCRFLHLHLPFVFLLFLAFLLHLVPELFIALVDDLAPVLLGSLHDPAFDVHARHALHSEDFEPDVLVSLIGVGHSTFVQALLFDLLLVDGLEVLQHGVNGGKLFGTDVANEVFGLLVLVQKHLVLEMLVAVIAEGS